MKKSLVLLVPVLILIVAVHPAAAITWGELDTAHPNVGAMVVDWPDYGPFQMCSGTLIHPRVFLTAAHCTHDLADYGIETVWVNFDPYAVNEDTLLLVEQVITHPDFLWGTADPHDIAALILAEPVTDIAPAPLPEEGFLNELRSERQLRDSWVGAPITVVGYGGVLDWPPPDITYPDDMRRVAVSEYRSLTPVWLHMSQNLNNDDGGTCFGDSGGPAFMDDPRTPELEQILVGITSWGDAQCVATSFDYRVDTAGSLAFIDGVIAGLDE
ncbi:MAG: trypsin-like serine protease [Anaerolineae bacterium]|nr:trypsin-like serine protease [Anaerolineae bacterium]